MTSWDGRDRLGRILTCSLAFLSFAALASCRSASRSTGSSAPSGSPAPAVAGHDMAGHEMMGGKPDSARHGYTAADVRFMHHMILHHAQALQMTALVPDRTTRDDIRSLAQRIEVSQNGEIAAMQRWLRRRGEMVPDPATHQAMAGMPMLMPGMLSDEQLARLAAANGTEFDRMFLDDMIRHHEGALTMVAEFFASRGAGQEPEIFGFASDVDADQRAEIRRMQALARSLPPAAPR